jgi:hypothetical protein
VTPDTQSWRLAQQTLGSLGFPDGLAPYNPVLAGTIPLGVDIPGSDLDIICHADDLDASIKPGAIQNCPMDRGVKVQLKFLQTSKTVLEASAATGGCRDVILTDGRVFSASGPAGATFWSLMAKAAGVSESELAGY